jgi:opacity protein-like surface antigen
MNRPLLASVAAALVLGAASAAFAQTDVSTSATSTRIERRFSLAAVTTIPNGDFPMVGVNAQYQLSNRFAVGGQLTLGMLIVDAGLGGRFFLNAEPRSGLYVDLSAHAIGGPLAEGLGGMAEVGYQFRARSGFLVEAGAGLYVMRGDGGCGCRRPGAEEHPWFTAPQLSMRFGYTF